MRDFLQLWLILHSVGRPCSNNSHTQNNVLLKIVIRVQELRNGSKTASALPDHLIDDTNIPPGDQPHIEPAPAHDTYHLPLFPRHSHEDYGSTLNAEHHYTPSVSSNDSCSSSGSKRKKGRRQVSRK